MFLLGLMSVMQIVFLPGYLFIRLVKLKSGFVTNLILAFTLSFIINHFIVVGLVLSGLYVGSSLYILFGVEVSLLLWILRGASTPTIAQVLEQSSIKVRVVLEHLSFRADDKRSITRSLFLIAAGAVAIGFSVYGLSNIGQIFTLWDDVNSWNRWAIEWSQNRFPEQTWEYPQLLPSNWSMTYVFIQNSTIWFFAKAVMPLFVLVLLLALFHLYVKTGEFGYALATILVPVLIRIVLGGRALVSGYADIPVSCFAFVGIYLLILARLETAVAEKRKLVLLGAIVCAGAALTKQAGLYIAILYPVLTWLIVVRPNWRIDSATMLARLKVPAASALLLMTLIAPGYVSKQIEIEKGEDQSVVSYLTGSIHGGRSVVDRFVFAAGVLKQRLGIPAAVLAILIPAVILTLAFSCYDPTYRWLTLLVVLPFLLIWSLFFSYDERNIALGLPFLGTAIGIGSVQIYRAANRALSRSGKSVYDWVPNLLQIRISHCAVPMAVILVVLNSQITPEKLTARQQELQKLVGVHEVNRQLYEIDDRSGIEGQILTDYQLLRWLPKLRDYYRPGWSTDLESWQKRFEDPHVKHALVHTRNTSPDIWKFLEEANNAGHCRLVFDNKHYRFYSKTEIR